MGMPKNSNDMPKGPNASPMKDGDEGFTSGKGSFGNKFGNPGGPNPGVSPTKTYNSLDGKTSRLGANEDSAGKNY